MNPKDNFLSALRLDRAHKGLLPYILPASFIPMPLEWALKNSGLELSSIRRDPKALAEMSLYIQSMVRADNLAMPFLMTVESEAYGGETEGVLQNSFPLSKVSDYKRLDKLSPEESGRLPVVIDTIKRLADVKGELLLLGELAAPLSLASSLMDGKVLLGALIKDPKGVRELLDFLSDNIISFALAQVRAGADVVLIIEPFGGVKQLGVELFEEFSLHYINRITDALHKDGSPVIVHVCGGVGTFAKTQSAKTLSADCLSVDNDCSITDIRLAAPDKAIMGDFHGGADAEGVSSAGADIISTSCALSPSTSAEALRFSRELAS
jgi:[methyl-Co(III) methanol-specific corrinoid protein]:coenzyme M methyltransferase